MTVNEHLELRVASFNIRNGMAWDGWNSWPLRRGATAKATARLGADVIGLQEVYGFQQRHLLRKLPDYAAVGRGRGGHLIQGRLLGGERSPVLFRSRRLRLDRHVTRWLSDTPDAPGSLNWGTSSPRIVTLAWFTDIPGKLRFGVANTHWDGASAASRRRSADALLGWLDLSVPWIVIGDLNATAGDPAVACLIAGGLRDALAHAGERGPQAATHHGWDGSTAGTRIDYVLVTPEWEVLSAAIDHARPGGRLPSDHWPVVATLRLDPGRTGRRRRP